MLVVNNQQKVLLMNKVCEKLLDCKENNNALLILKNGFIMFYLFIHFYKYNSQYNINKNEGIAITVA